VYYFVLIPISSIKSKDTKNLLYFKHAGGYEYVVNIHTTFSTLGYG